MIDWTDYLNGKAAIVCYSDDECVDLFATATRDGVPVAVVMEVNRRTGAQSFHLNYAGTVDEQPGTAGRSGFYTSRDWRSPAEYEISWNELSMADMMSNFSNEDFIAMLEGE